MQYHTSVHKGIMMFVGVECACEDPARQHQSGNGEGSQYRRGQIRHLTVPPQEDRLQADPRNVKE